MIEELIKEFYQTGKSNQITESDRNADYLHRLYEEIVQLISADYTTYKKNIARFLAALEEINPTSLYIGTTVFLNLLPNLASGKSYPKASTEVINADGNKADIQSFMKLVEKSLKKNNRPRISSFDIDLSSLSIVECQQLASLFIDKIQDDAKVLSWSNTKVEETLFHLMLLRPLLIKSGDTFLYYKAIGIYLDRLSSSEYHQPGRDICEEIIIASFLDNIPELGFFDSFRFYSTNHSAHASLAYANISLSIALRNDANIDDRYVREMIWQSIKYFRNINLPFISIQIYERYSSNLILTGYERRALTQSYFSSLLSIKDKRLPSLLLDYFNQEREEIFKGGIHEATPWLITLLNIKRIYTDADFTTTGLGFYLSVFETIVPNDTIKKQRDIIEGNTDSLKDILKESLNKLNTTRNKQDLIYDNDTTLKISNRLISSGAKTQDISAMLMSMIVKSDFSLVFEEKQSADIAPMVLPDIYIDIESTYKIYENLDDVKDLLRLQANEAIIWIAQVEGSLYLLTLNDSNFIITQSQSYSQRVYKELDNTSYFTHLSFSDTYIDNRGNSQEKFPEDHLVQSKAIAEMLAIGRIQIPSQTMSLMVVKDFNLSRYPHNLFISADDDQFIAHLLPVTNIISTEWYLKQQRPSFLKRDYTKSIWIPIESEDRSLDLLYDKIRDTIVDHKFLIFKDVKMAIPISSDINIICSHGGDDISQVQVVSQSKIAPITQAGSQSSHKNEALKEEVNYVPHLDLVIGKGKILILFVCHSGSEKNDFFRNTSASLVKRFISEGYEAVIAPFWALDVTLAGIWLPEFLSSLDSNFTIAEAVFLANSKIYERYSTPVAWACLHLYGNPDIKLSSL